MNAAELQKTNQLSEGPEVNDIHEQTSTIKPVAGIKTPDYIKDKYTFIDRLGHGTQGSVFKAIRHSDGKIVAVKKLRIDSVNTWKEYDLFHREADVLSGIHEHGVAEFYEAIENLGSNPAEAYIVQELIEGRSLQIMLKTGFRFTVSRIFNMALGMIDLLERLHSHNPPIIHRDIKPNNIIMRPLAGQDDFEPYLIDFGAVANPTVQKGGSTVAGTYGYMPSEQLVGHPCPASDIYALGATIVYMLTGVEPADMRIADFRLVIDPYLENVPRPIVSVLHKMLDPKPETRLCDYQRLREIFTQFANDIYSIDDDSALQDTKAINQKIAAVNAFNQAGNLDLWMNLSETTPRMVPEPFADTVLNLANIVKSNLVKKSLPKTIIKSLVICIPAIIFIILIVNYIVKDNLYSQMSSEEFFFYIFLVIILIGVSFIFLLNTFSELNTIRKINKSRNEKLKLYELAQKEPDLLKCVDYETLDDLPLLTLLKFGRKGIATIVDFEDLPTPVKYRNYNPYRNEISSESRVPFRLRYRFNPPDDASADDLIHNITIYNHQTEGLEPGTPIPILYYINPDDNSDVISMPYPFPFKEIENTQVTLVNKDNLYCKTKGVY